MDLDIPSDITVGEFREYLHKALAYSRLTNLIVYIDDVGEMRSALRREEYLLRYQCQQIPNGLKWLRNIYGTDW